MLAMFDSPESWIVVAAIAVFLFGSAKLPELARSLGRSRSEFEKARRETADQDPKDGGGTA
ncbi:MAG TPA: twin-arginine translocase TatA/TatE family subunit [Actinomycetota bacterium]|nr:twin-arginine translocase TatA/TatE family subunit [Actinomycetota bacterium]